MSGGIEETVVNTKVLGPMPANVKDRICALKRLQLKFAESECKFYERVHQLEKEFDEVFRPLFEERRKIVVGEKEADEEDKKHPFLVGADDTTLKELYDLSDPDTDKKGIPDFWLNVLRGHEMTNDMVQDVDVPVLSYLTDITCATLVDPPRFTLEFHFAENPYFKNKVLTKEYHLEIIPEGEFKILYDGPTVERAIGCTIDWKEGKNITKKVVKRKQKKGTNAGKFMTKTVKADSFFNFFDPPKAPEDTNEEENDDDVELLQMDYEIGQFMRDAIIPKAVLYFTGEVHSDDGFDFIGEDGDFSSEDDDEA